jgi:hypothetical protein
MVAVVSAGTGTGSSRSRNRSSAVRISDKVLRLLFRLEALELGFRESLGLPC